MKAIDQGHLGAAFADDMTPKFLATVDPEGKPSVVLIASLKSTGPDSIAFADFLMNKTADNLEANTRTGVLVITENLQWWTMTADLKGWERTGALVELFNQNELFRYNAYTGIRRAGRMKLDRFLAEGKCSKLGLAADFGLTRVSRGSFINVNPAKKLPPTVKEKFDRIAAVKIISYVDEKGYPVCLPILSAQSAGSGTLVFGLGSAPNLINTMEKGTPCAVNVITFEPTSYQIKGTFDGFSKSPLGKRGVIKIKSVWCTSPPLCGERIDYDMKNNQTS